jgi:hypothetical protein
VPEYLFEIFSVEGIGEGAGFSVDTETGKVQVLTETMSKVTICRTNLLLFRYILPKNNKLTDE